MTEQACRELARWRAEGCGEITMSVNVSPQRFQDLEFVRRIKEIVDRTGVPSNRIQLEITEGSALQQSEPTLSTLHRLRSEGFKIAIDDFGVGYSSLSNLRNLPVDVLKIDRSFVQKVGGGSTDDAFVASIVTLAHGLGIPVVAEGVEREEQRAALRRLECDFAQGHLFSRPQPSAACGAFFDRDAVPWTRDSSA